ncbi:MAG: histidine kinase [Candidatus Dormibacteraceae bacterium]
MGWRRLAARAQVQDVALVLALLAAALVELLLRQRTPDWHWLGPALTILPLLGRSRQPALLFAAAQALGGAIWLDVPLVVMVIAWAVGLYSIGVHNPWHGWSLLVPVVVAAVLAAVGIPLHFVLPPVPAWAAALVGGLAMWLVGGAVRDRDGRARRLCRTRQLAERSAIQEERMRIAGEMEDLIAHRVGEMVVQAGAARAMLDSSRTQAERSLRSVEEGGRQTLGELRRLLGALSAEPEAGR